MKLRDPISGLTHFIGAALAIVGLVALLIRPFIPLTVYHYVSFSIFGAAMILLYTFSALYHWLPVGGRTLDVFRTIDHVMIFVFIAATYTPVCLVILGGGWGWAIFGSVWGLTLAGLFLKIFWLESPRFLSTAIYLLMGWIIIIGIWPLSQRMNPYGLLWLLTGGIFYSIGAAIYALKKPDPWPEVFGFHEIFHVLILLGSLAHFWMMYRYV
jgi:hemolysin III